MSRAVHNSDNPQVTLHTNHGEILVELFADRAPKTVENFLGLARHEPAADADPDRDTNTWEDPNRARRAATRCTRGTSSTASSRGS